MNPNPMPEIIAATTSAGPLQGSVVWWDLHDSETPAADFLQRVKDAGLDPALLPEVPPPARALRDAGQETLKGHGNRKGDYLLRPAGTNGAVTFYALVAEHKVQEGTLAHNQSATFAVSADGRLAVSVHDPACSAHAAAVEARYHRIYGTYQSRDVREWIIRVLRDVAAVPLRSHGGLYWVPATFQETVEKIGKVIDGVGSCSFAILPIHATTFGTKAIAQATRVTLEEGLRDIKAELDKWALDLAHGDGPRPSTVNRRIEDFAALRDRVLLYRDILSLQTEDIEQKLHAAEQQAKQILTGIEVIR